MNCNVNENLSTTESDQKNDFDSFEIRRPSISVRNFTLEKIGNINCSLGTANSLVHTKTTTVSTLTTPTSGTTLTQWPSGEKIFL